MRRLNLATALFLVILIYTTVSPQSTKIFWIAEGTTNGKIQASGINGGFFTDIFTGLELPRALAIDTTVSPQKIYVAEIIGQRIIRMDIDGSNPEDVVTGVSSISDLELDLLSRTIFWIADSWDDDRISRADMDGLNSNVEDILTSTWVGLDFMGIGIDVLAQKIYWVQANNGGSDKILRMNYDGSGYEILLTIADVSLIGPWDIDVVGDKFYFTDPGLGVDVIYSAFLDGSGIDTVVAEAEALYFTVDTTANYIYWGDDYTIHRANLDNTNKVELVTGLQNYVTGIALSSDSILLSMDDDYIFPQNFKLHQNYPNPFNPNTRISWQSPVGSWHTLKVYDVLGNIIATLVDEYKSAGSYEVEFNKSSIKQLPSSGVYFYQIKAGDIIQTRKMLLLK
jgi:hypothetical protein